MDLRTNSDYFTVQHWLVGFYNRDGVCLLRGTDWVFIYNSTFCPHSVFMCFVWIWGQTAIISLYSINWLVCITETECVYCAVWTGSAYIIQVNLFLCIAWCGERSAIKFKAVSSPSPLWGEEASHTTRGEKNTNASKTKLKHVYDCKPGPENKYGFAGRQSSSKTSALLCPAQL